MASPKKHDAPLPDDVDGGMTRRRFQVSFRDVASVNQRHHHDSTSLEGERRSDPEDAAGGRYCSRSRDPKPDFTHTHARTAVGVAKQALETNGGFRKSTMMTPTSFGTDTASGAKFPKPHMTTDRLVSGRLRIGTSLCSYRITTGF